MFKKFREKSAKKYLRTRHTLTDDSQNVFVLKNTKTACVLYEVNNSEAYKQVESLVSELTLMNIRVQVIGYVDQKQAPFFFDKRIFQNIITKKDLNWRFFPTKNKDVQTFINSDCDLLIDLTLKESLPLLYCVALSKAKFKAARFDTEHTRYFNMMIYASENDSIYDLGKQVLHYLNKINS